MGFGFRAGFSFLAFILFTGQAAAQSQAGIASAHPLATEAGHRILQQGGNAFDAAVAVSAALAVVEPAGSGLGGGGFWLLHRAKDGYQTMVDGREKAPAAAHRDLYLDAKGEVVPNLSLDGPLAAGIPGTPAGLAHIAKKYGRLSLAKSLQPAIEYARKGFEVDEHYRHLAGFRLKALKQSSAASAIFLKEGDVPPVGFVVKQPDLARTLEALAKDGHEGFYQGKIARQLVMGVRGASPGKGIWTLQDLANYDIKERKPVTGNYRGLKITSASPPSSGGTAIMSILNILSGYELDKMAQSQRTHLIVEAMRRAYRDRAIYLGDPDFVDVPDYLTDVNYAAGLRAAIHPGQAMPSEALPGINKAPEGRHTTHFSIIDQDGNRVAATLTVNYPFGACFVPPGTGVLLNNEMDDFSAKPGVPNAYGLVGAEANAIAANKRPLSSMSPTFLEDDKAVVALGTPGGSRIISMVMLAILDYMDGGGAESMVKKGRFHHQYLPDKIFFEKGVFSQQLQETLQDLGHEIAEGNTWGNMHVVIKHKKTGKMQAASDPRGGGQATVK